MNLQLKENPVQIFNQIRTSELRKMYAKQTDLPPIANARICLSWKCRVNEICLWSQEIRKINPYFTACKCNLGWCFKTHFIDSLFDPTARYDKTNSYLKASAPCELHYMLVRHQIT